MLTAIWCLLLSKVIKIFYWKLLYFFSKSQVFLSIEVCLFLLLFFLFKKPNVFPFKVVSFLRSDYFPLKVVLFSLFYCYFLCLFYVLLLLFMYVCIYLFIDWFHNYWSWLKQFLWNNICSVEAFFCCWTVDEYININ